MTNRGADCTISITSISAQLFPLTLVFPKKILSMNPMFKVKGNLMSKAYANTSIATIGDFIAANISISVIN